MRRTHVRALGALSVLLLLFSGILVEFVQAKGLYVGHGRRSHDHPWSVRLNLTGGLHGGSDPWEGDPGADDRWAVVGGYGQAGVEFHMGSHNSLELYGSLRDIGDEEDFLDVDLSLGGAAEVGTYDYELETRSLGLTLRHYSLSDAGSAYFGVGGGWLETDAFYQEIVAGEVQPTVEEEETGAEAHVLLGWDGLLGPSLALGLELGYRHTWLDYEAARFDDTGDTSGFFGGLRLGLLFGH